MEPAQTITERYDSLARDYREFWAPTLRIAGRRLIREVAEIPAQGVLDVATGVGVLLPDLRATFPSARIVGVDRSRGMLALVPKDEFPVAAMDACRLGVATGSVDVVLLAFVLFHIEEPGVALREAGRVLTVTGRVGCITWGGEFESKASRIFDECLDAHVVRTSDPSVVAREEAVDSPAKMERLLRDAGFLGVRTWEEDLVDRFDIDRLLSWKSNLGSSGPRFRSLTPEARNACLTSVREKVESLRADDFIARGRVTYSVARSFQA
jgi:ubiquinone/menaquinone biosynthesis C-methylase UbiE